MTQKTAPRFPWERFWVPHGETPSLAGAYFAEPASDEFSWLLPRSNGVALSSLVDVPCLILIGNMGMGKSTAVRDEVARLSEKLRGSNHVVVLKDLKRLSEIQIYQQVFNDPAVAGWVRGEHALTLFLDSMDECWRRVDELESILVGELDRYVREAKQPFFLRVTCRSAEWRVSMAGSLKRLFSSKEAHGDAVRVYALAPLSESNVREAARISRLDQEAVLQKIAKRRVEALACHPITLSMLLQTYKESGELPASRVQIYERGCLRFCTDLHSTPNSTVKRVTTAAQRLAVASRLAAVSVLTNRYLVNSDANQPSGTFGVLDISDVFGYFEERFEGQSVAVDQITAMETIQSGLFSQREDELQNWAHQSYLEFLAARYLSRSGLKADQLATLLVDTNDNAGRIIPQLEETACWLLEMMPNLFGILGLSNAEVFIRINPELFDDNQREILVAGYLESIRRHQASEFDWTLKDQLARLAHPRLGKQLSGIIRDRKEDPLVRESAIDIAAFCQCRAAAPQLISVFSDPSDIFRVRQRAAFALEQVADDEVRKDLKKEVVFTSLDDHMDELKGFYLRLLWPSALSVAEVLPLLTPQKRQNYTGSYKIFLMEFARTLPNYELPLVLDWMRKHRVDFDTLGPFGHFPSEIALRALHTAEDKRVRSSLIDLIVDLGDPSDDFLDGLRENQPASIVSRRALWEELVSSGKIEPHKLLSFRAIMHAKFLVSEDFCFFLEKYKTTTGNARQSWKWLMFWVFNPEDAAALDQISVLARSDSGIAEILAQKTSCPLLPEELNWQKAQYERRTSGANAMTQPRSIPDCINEGLDRFERGEALGFCWVMELLDTDPKEPYHRFGSLNVKVSAGKIWPSLSSSVKQRIIHDALAYIGSQELSRSEVWDEEKHLRVYQAAAPTFMLLFDEAKQALSSLPPEQLEKWIPVLFAYRDRHNGSHSEGYDFIFSLMFRKCPGPFISVLEEFLARHVNHDNKRALIWRLASIWLAPVENVFRKLLHKQVVKPTAAADILQLMSTQNPNGTRELLEQIFEERNHETVCSIHVPVAGMVLLTAFPSTWAPRIIETFKSEVTLAQRIAWLLLRGVKSPDWMSKVPAMSLAVLWDWLDVQFPGDPYEEDGWHGSVTPLHEMFDFRQAVFQALVQRNSPDSCEAVQWLMELRPKAFWLGDILGRMRKLSRGVVWKRPCPSAIMQRFQHGQKRLICTAGDLQSLLLDSLKRYQQALHGSPPRTELWNEVTKARKKILIPKDELNLSNCLKLHFERDLAEFGIIANREVLIRPRLGSDPAQLVDVLVHALPFQEDGSPGKPVSVVVEVKCCWNPGVLTDMERQLVGRYLATNQFNFGIYVAAYFTCDSWNCRDPKRTASVGKMRLPTLAIRLRRQATGLCSPQKRVDAFVLDARLLSAGKPRKSKRH